MPRSNRVLRALSREGLTVTHDGHGVYTVRLTEDPHSVTAEILLPDSLPLEGKALRQLAELAAVRHPHGGRVCRACAAPDFHPGDSGIAIGSVVEMDGMVIPQAVGGDINCGMRFHTTELTLDQFLSKKSDFVEKMKGDYLLGTRDVLMSAKSMREMFTGGVRGWVNAVQENPLGCMTKTDLNALEDDTQRILYDGSFEGDASSLPKA